jgi:hypothetical protein
MRPASLIFESERRRPQFSTKIKNTYYLYRSPQNKYFSCFWWSVCLKCDLRSSFLKVRDAGRSSQPKSEILIICIDLHKISTSCFWWSVSDDLRPSFLKVRRGRSCNQNQKYLLLYRSPQNKYFSCFWWSVCLKCDLRPSFLKARTQATVQPKSKILIFCIDLPQNNLSCLVISLLKMRPASLIFESERRRPQFSTKIKNTYYLYWFPQNKYFSCFLVIRFA